MSQQRKSNSMKIRRSAILHFWNNDQRSPVAISLITKTPKQNITKIKQQSTIEDRARKDRLLRTTVEHLGNGLGETTKQHKKNWPQTCSITKL